MKDVNQSSATSREKLAPRKKFDVLPMCPHDHTRLQKAQRGTLGHPGEGMQRKTSSGTEP